MPTPSKPDRVTIAASDRDRRRRSADLVPYEAQGFRHTCYPLGRAAAWRERHRGGYPDGLSARFSAGRNRATRP